LFEKKKLKFAFSSKKKTQCFCFVSKNFKKCVPIFKKIRSLERKERKKYIFVLVFEKKKEIMLRHTKPQFNFYPFGRKTGPLNNYEQRGLRNNYMTRLVDIPERKTVTQVSRHRLKLECPLCEFRWDFETLTVQCPGVKEHNQREKWLSPFWLYKRDQPYKYYKYMPVTFNPRTHQFMADGFSRSNNNERRSQGLTGRVRCMQRESTGIPTYISGIGSYSTKWETHFPYPG
jgi:hypothetical protein